MDLPTCRPAVFRAAPARVVAAALLVGLALGPPSPADDGGLTVGDLAPTTVTDRGREPPEVVSLQRGVVHVVTFFDTRSDPCRAALPQLADLAKRFRRDARFLGIVDQSAEPADMTPLEEAFGGVRTFRVLFDVRTGTAPRPRDGTAEGDAWRVWMDGVGVHGSPLAFVVAEDGRVAWVGNPLDGLDDVLTRIVAGHFDPVAAAAAQRRVRLLEERSRTAIELGRWDDALSIIDEMVDLQPGLAGRAATMKVEIVLFQKGDLDAGRAAAAALLDGPAADDAESLNDIAQRLLDLPDPSLQVITTAAALAERAVALFDDANPWCLDTLARARFLGGDRAEAVALQAKAVALIDEAGGRRDRRAMRLRLRDYRAALAEERIP